jgi:hypothetical protein
MLTLHSSKSCKAGLRSRSSHVQVHTKYIPVQYSTYYIHTKYILVCISTQNLLLSIYSVQGCASGIPRLVALQSCDLVKLGVQKLCILCMAECFNGMYSSIVRNHLELYVPGTYLLVMLFTILRDFLFLHLYLVHPDLHCANHTLSQCRSGCTKYIGKNKKKSQDSEQHYKEVCTATEQYKAVSYER